MNKTAIYPGTFDPITFGHIDVIKKSLKLFDKIVVAVSDESNKNYLFSSEERIEIVNKALFNDLKLNNYKNELPCCLIYKDEKYSLLINKTTMEILKNEEELIELIKSKFA